MRNYRRLAAARGRRSGNQDFWLSFSDLMSVLVLVFILIMFYILYKYVVIADAYQVELDNMKVIQLALESKETELNSAQSQLAVREEELASAQAELDSAQAELTSAQEELTTAQGELTAAQEELAAQQLMLNLAQEAMSATEEELEGKQAELEAALAELSARETELSSLEEQLNSQQATLNAQQAQLDAAQITLDAQEAQLLLAQTQLDEQQAQLEALVGVRTRIIHEMSESLKSNNISATVDSATGAIILASDVMFEYGSSELSDEGKAFIDDFLPVYLSVLLSDANLEYVSEIIIEGHTDTTDTYIRNLELSQERAFAVVEYVLEDSDAGISRSQKQQFRELLTANGRSYSDPIYDARGRVDPAASRRVVFKFRLTDEKMIQQMQQILEDSGE